jgi:hypothetical protein
LVPDQNIGWSHTGFLQSATVSITAHQREWLTLTISLPARYPGGYLEQCLFSVSEHESYFL